MRLGLYSVAGEWSALGFLVPRPEQLSLLECCGVKGTPGPAADTHFCPLATSCSPAACSFCRQTGSQTGIQPLRASSVCSSRLPFPSRGALLGSCLQLINRTKPLWCWKLSAVIYSGPRS